MQSTSQGYCVDKMQEEPRMLKDKNVLDSHNISRINVRKLLSFYHLYMSQYSSFFSDTELGFPGCTTVFFSSPEDTSACSKNSTYFALAILEAYQQWKAVSHLWGNSGKALRENTAKDHLRISWIRWNLEFRLDPDFELLNQTRELLLYSTTNVLKNSPAAEGGKGSLFQNGTRGTTQMLIVWRENIARTREVHHPLLLSYKILLTGLQVTKWLCLCETGNKEAKSLLATTKRPQWNKTQHLWSPIQYYFFLFSLKYGMKGIWWRTV